jgi:putative FmdB family regulatory protein
MPIYGYACQECGHTLDALQKISDDPLVDCPACDKPALKKQLSAPRFRLKGKGWYETDFKSDNQRNLAGDSDSGKKGKSNKKDDKSSSTSDKKSTSSKDSSSGSKASAA